jgi:hypothetical protein
LNTNITKLELSKKKEIDDLIQIALANVETSITQTKTLLYNLFPEVKKKAAVKNVQGVQGAFESHPNHEAVKTAADARAEERAAHLRNTRGGEVSPPRRFASYRSSGHRHRESSMDYHSSGPRSMEPIMML